MTNTEIESKAKQLEEIFRLLRKKRPILSEPSELKPAQMYLLWLLFKMSQKNQIVKPSDLSKKLNISMAGVTHHIDALEKAGFVKRTVREENRREIELSLTEKAKVQILEIKKKYWHNLCMLVKYLGEDDSDRLVQIFSKIIEFMDQNKSWEK